MNIERVNNNLNQDLKIKKIAKEFEKMMIKEVFKLQKQNNLVNSIYNDFYFDAISDKICEKGVGISDYIIKNFESSLK